MREREGAPVINQGCAVCQCSCQRRRRTLTHAEKGGAARRKEEEEEELAKNGQPISPFTFDIGQSYGGVPREALNFLLPSKRAAVVAGGVKLSGKKGRLTRMSSNQYFTCEERANAQGM